MWFTRLQETDGEGFPPSRPPCPSPGSTDSTHPGFLGTWELLKALEKRKDMAGLDLAVCSTLLPPRAAGEEVLWWGCWQT